MDETLGHWPSTSQLPPHTPLQIISAAGTLERGGTSEMSKCSWLIQSPSVRISCEPSFPNFLHNYSTYQCCTSERMHKIDRYIQETEIKGNPNSQSSPQASSLSCCLLCNRCFLSASWIRACSAFTRVLALRLWLTPCLLKAPAIMRCATRAFVAGRGAGGSKSGKIEALRRNQWVGQFHHLRQEALIR